LVTRGYQGLPGVTKTAGGVTRLVGGSLLTTDEHSAAEPQPRNNALIKPQRREETQRNAEEVKSLGAKSS